MLLFTVLLGFMYIVTCAFSYWRGQEIDRLERELYDAEVGLAIVSRTNFDAGYKAGKESMRRTQAGGQ